MADQSDAPEAFGQNAVDENWCVYLLRCRNNSLYTGMTNNLDRRLRAHEQGKGSKYVRSWRPFELVKVIPCRDAGEARRLERALKRLSRKEKLDALDLTIMPKTGVL